MKHGNVIQKECQKKEKMEEYNKYKSYASGIKPSDRGYNKYTRSPEYIKEHK